MDFDPWDSATGRAASEDVLQARMGGGGTSRLMPRPACGHPLSVRSWQYNVIWEHAARELMLSRPLWHRLWLPRSPAVSRRIGRRREIAQQMRLLACLLAAGGRCVGEQRTSRTWTYLTRCCNTAAAGCCTPDGWRAVSYAAMRTCLSQLDAGAGRLQ